MSIDSITLRQSSFNRCGNTGMTISSIEAWMVSSCSLPPPRPSLNSRTCQPPLFTKRMSDQSTRLKHRELRRSCSLARWLSSRNRTPAQCVKMAGSWSSL
jgi:hypothetical protein